MTHKSSTDSSAYDVIDRALTGGMGVTEVKDLMIASWPTVTELDVYARWKALYRDSLITNSPYSMVQERVRGSSDYPWKVVVLSALMNRTHARQVRPMIRPLFLTFPTPRSMAESGLELESIIRPLGFSNQRAKRLREFSHDYDVGKSIDRCRGVGEFGHQAVRAFVHERFDFDPTDGFLRKYVEWRRTGSTEWDR